MFKRILILCIVSYLCESVVNSLESLPSISANDEIDIINVAKPFQFEYAVKDLQSGNEYSHSTNENGENRRGTYSVRMADGRKQTVNYIATNGAGYKAEVAYEEDQLYQNSMPSYSVLIKENSINSQDYPDLLAVETHEYVQASTQNTSPKGVQIPLIKTYSHHIPKMPLTKVLQETGFVPKVLLEHETETHLSPKPENLFLHATDEILLEDFGKHQTYSKPKNSKSYTSDDSTEDTVRLEVPIFHRPGRTYILAKDPVSNHSQKLNEAYHQLTSVYL